MPKPSKVQDSGAMLRIAQALEVGMPLGHAIKYAGVPERTVYRWRAKGKEEAETYPDLDQADWSPQRAFFELTELAIGKGVFSLLNIIQTAAKDGTWQAAAWLLERRFPEDFGRKTQHNHTGEALGPTIVINHAELATEKVRELAGSDYPKLSRTPAQIVVVDAEEDDTD